jgi:hypothetical protein
MCPALSGNTSRDVYLRHTFVYIGKRCLFSGRAHFLSPLTESIAIRRWIPMPIYKALLPAYAADNIDPS